MDRTRVVIMGAAGRDFHDFNVVYRDDPTSDVVAFTATQIPGIAGRVYPAELAGPLYPQGIPIVAEAELERAHPRREGRHGRLRLQRRGPRDGHARRLARPGRRRRLRPARAGPHDAQEPPPGDRRRRHPHRVRQEPDHALRGQAAHRARPHPAWSSATPCPTATSWPSGCSATRPMPTSIATRPPSRSARSTSRISTRARSSTPAWTTRPSCARPSRRPTSSCGTAATTTSPSTAPTSSSSWPTRLRQGDERRYHPGETNVRMADVVIINKVDSADPADVAAVRATIAELNPTAEVLAARSDLTLEGPPIEGRRVVVVEDGPDPDPRRHGLRGRRRRRAPLRGRPAGRPAARGSRLDPRRPGPLSAARAARPRDGLRARRRSTSSRRPSTPWTPTWSCPPRPST